MHPEKLNSVLTLSSKERYEYFIKKVADFETVYLIQDDDKYVTIGDDKNEIIIPVYPEAEFAELNLQGTWINFSVEEMELSEFLDWLDELHEKRIKVAGFPSSENSGIVITADEMKNHILFEMQQYE